MFTFFKRLVGKKKTPEMTIPPEIFTVNYVAPLLQYDPAIFAPLKLDPIKLTVSTINITASLARSAYDSQSEEKKAKPITRFWEQAETLQQFTAQHIASILITNIGYDDMLTHLHKNVSNLITEYLMAVNNGITQERFNSYFNETTINSRSSQL